jgi:uncharacterized protein DUF6064
MSEWWTYRLSSFLLFSPHTYYRLIELYNTEVWPEHVAALILGLAILALWRRAPHWIAAIMAGLWCWVAWAWLISRYDTINWAARYFAIGFFVQGLLFIGTGFLRRRLKLSPFALRPFVDPLGAAGKGFFLFALVFYPMIGRIAGRPWIQTEAFGIAPDPTIVATLGLVVAAVQPHWGLLVIPVLWCLISGATLWTMESPEALLLPLVAVTALMLSAWKARQPMMPAATSKRKAEKE